MKQQRRKHVDGGASKASRKTIEKEQDNRLHLKVGEPWSEPLSVAEDSYSSIWKSRVTVLLAGCFMAVFIAITAYAMVLKDSQLLSRIISIDEAGLCVIGIWATGKAALKVLSGWKDHH